MQAIREIEYTGEDIFSRLSGSSQPAIIRGLVEDWPVVNYARRSEEALQPYLLGFYEGALVNGFFSESEDPRLFYENGLERLNFRQQKVPMDELLAAVNSGDRTVYMGSMAVDYCLPGFSSENNLPAGDRHVSTRIWIGTRSTVSAHYDAMENIACVCAGRRRFTLFPPEQVANLYVGPLDFTPAGQAVSLVDLDAPDFDKYPRFADALSVAQHSELLPGDAIYIPSMWWHHVSGLGEFNILVNHWWRDVPAYLGAPGDALFHALLSIRHLPEVEREAWRALFDHYVFNAADIGYIPEEKRGVLGDMNEDWARQTRAYLRNQLDR